MKQYKLKRDLPTFNEGDEFCLNSNNDLYLKDSNIMAYSHITLEKFPNILTDWFEEVHEYKRWRAEKFYKYWFVDNCGRINYYYEYGDKEDDDSHAIGNYFKTEAEAKVYKEYLLAKQKLIDSARGYRPVLDGHNHYLEYCNGAFTKHFSVYETTTYTPGVIYFKCQEDAEESFKKYRDEWEIVRKYEMGEIND